MMGIGDLEALQLQTRSTSIKFDGVGTVRIGLSDTLSVVADGIGTLEYRGSPTLNLNTDGLVTVRQVD